MAQTKYPRDLQRLNCLGLDVNRPLDSIKEGKFPYLQNVRAYQAGRIESRLGLTDINAVVTGQTPVHSCRRLNDPRNASWTRVLGAGTHLAYGQTTFTDVDSGYSGDPLALVPYRPDQSPDSWMYVADRSRMRKIARAGTLHTIGLAPPTAIPAPALTNSPAYSILDEFDATAGWVQGGTAGAPTLLSAGPGMRTTSTIAQILYDTGTTGWASINLASMIGIGQGERVTINSGGGTAETVTIQRYFPSTPSTTVASVIYDSGTTGLCSVVLTTALEQIAINSLIRNTTRPENVRVVGLVDGPDGRNSIRISTTSTWAAGDTLAGLESFRAYLTNNHAAAESVGTDGVRSAITTGTGTLAKTVALNLTSFATGNPSHDEDYMHISMRVDRPDLITEIKVQLDVDATTNTFTRNFYTRSFRAADLTPVARNQQPASAVPSLQIHRFFTTIPGPFFVPMCVVTVDGEKAIYLGGEAIRANTDDTFAVSKMSAPLRQAVAESGAASSSNALSQQMGLGDVQWSELKFRLSDLTRVGTDYTRTLAHIAAIQIVVNVTGAVNLDLDSWWIGGGFGPDVLEGTGIPYLYRYRARCPATGATSNWSPTTRLELRPYRQSVTVSLTQYAAPAGTSFATGDFVLDIERFGGSHGVWHYVGTTANGATPSFIDKYGDDQIAALPGEGQDHWQLWPIIGAPVSGTTGTVSGTMVNDSSTNFSTSWAPGTVIKINGIAYTIYRVLSTSRLEINENAGSQSGVEWRIEEPTIQAQPLPCLWGDDQLGALFACGDTTNPGRLYWTTMNDPDSTRESNYLDITSPSEPLMNGVVYNGRSFVWSSERWFQILPDQLGWRAEVLPGPGLFARWAITREPAPFICYLTRTGIMLTTGGQPVSITDGDLSPIFPNEANIGSQTYGIPSPLMLAANESGLRLSWYDDVLYFDYPSNDTAGVVSPTGAGCASQTPWNAGSSTAARDGSAITTYTFPGDWSSIGDGSNGRFDFFTGGTSGAIPACVQNMAAQYVYLHDVWNATDDVGRGGPMVNYSNPGPGKQAYVLEIHNLFADITTNARIRLMKWRLNAATMVASANLPDNDGNLYGGVFKGPLIEPSTIRLESRLISGNVQLKAYWNGVLYITYLDTTNVLLNGAPGFYGRVSGNITQMNTWYAYEIGTGL